MRFATASLALVIAALSASPAAAGDLAGRVHDAKARPVAGAVVAIPALGLEAVSDAEGRYSFTDLPAGDAELAIAMGNGSTQHMTIALPADGVVERNIFLLSASAMSNARKGLAAAMMASAEQLADDSWSQAEQMLKEADRAKAKAWNWQDDNA